MTPHYLILNNHNKQKEKSNKIVNGKYGLIYSILFTNYYNTRIETHPSLGLISTKMGIYKKEIFIYLYIFIKLRYIEDKFNNFNIQRKPSYI